MEFFCDTCNSIVCALCVTEDHGGHRFELLQYRADKKRVGMLSICSDIKTHLRSVESSANIVQERLVEYEAEKAILHYTIDAVTDEVISLLRRRRKTAHAELENASLSSVGRLQSQQVFL